MVSQILDLEVHYLYKYFFWLFLFRQVFEVKDWHGSDILALRQNFVVGHKKWIFAFGILCRFQKIAKKEGL